MSLVADLTWPEAAERVDPVPGVPRRIHRPARPHLPPSTDTDVATESPRTMLANRL
jgi:hypothetical protein